MRVWMTAIVSIWIGCAALADPMALAAVNAQRAEAGRSALIYDMRLEAAARAHAEDMARAGFFGHTGSDGSDISQRLDRVGYQYCFGAENIAAGQRTLLEVMAAWMDSPGHRKNILHRKAKAVVVVRVDGNRWVMVLAAPC